MHGVFEENAGVFPKVFENEDDYFSYLSETAIFTATRGEVTYYFEPIRAKDYLNNQLFKPGLFMVKKFQFSRVRTTFKRIVLINFKI